MIAEFIIGGIIVAGVVLFIIKHKKIKNEAPEANATVLPIPPPPKRDSPK